MKYEKATFAGGCFWCMVQPFEEMPGIINVRSGYTGGHAAHPSYENVKNGHTGHFEAVQITYDPQRFPYQQLLDLYWAQIDPTDDGGQFHDRGPQYRTAIFYHQEDQRCQAQTSKEAIEKSGKFKGAPIVTEILPATTFYEAEEWHQKFYKKQPEAYKEDRAASGRDAFIHKYWHADE
ncbi:peptide-methionine (S)-S-oxide reductase MsrA [Salicibibacter cibarius]|uniref:Peptide methionine sulfoxide reductase MsrA n=1 Tax=Salicibibacter cibarius TaxID=2743000 RepID=A0A7T7CB51_9BACI|nr:peptide-methionine (S)-S-oxide reductase MsrA [Salicibibacter cibarius]QQK75599.1 peptide-methionine (S)-S-oxide reductase MsrA [Salicibibacter cibarius]